MEVARRHNLLLNKDDPILAAVTLNELVLSSYLARMEQAAGDAERQAAGRVAQEVGAVKAIAERMIVGASTYFADEVRKVADQLIATVDAKLKAAQDTARAVEEAKRPAQWAAAAAIVAAVLAIGMALGMALAK